MNYLPKNIRFLREVQGKTQRYCADYVGTTAPNWNNYELERNKPKFDILISISDLFSISIDNLVKTDLTKVLLTQKGSDLKKEVKSTTKSTTNSTTNLADSNAVEETQASYGKPVQDGIWQEKALGLQMVVDTQKMLIESLQAQIKHLESGK